VLLGEKCAYSAASQPFVTFHISHSSRMRRNGAPNGASLVAIG